MTHKASTKRVFMFIGATLLIEGAVLVAIFFLVLANLPGWFAPVIAALPGVLLTAFLPVFRDQGRVVRIIGIALITFGMILGTFVNAEAFLEPEEALPTAVVGAVTLCISALVALFDRVREQDLAVHVATAETDRRSAVVPFLLGAIAGTVIDRVWSRGKNAP